LKKEHEFVRWCFSRLPFFNGKCFTFTQWLRLKEHDDLKTQWCNDSHVQLIRINYKQQSKIASILNESILLNKKGKIYNMKLKNFIIGENVEWTQNGVLLRINETVTINLKSFKNVEIMERFNMDGVFGAIYIDNDFHMKYPQCWHTAGLFDDGFGVGISGGSIGGVSLYNFGDEAITIEKGTRICQMVFFESNPAKKYDGFYNQNQTIKSQYEK